jgi:hypothetical protein
MKKKLFGMGIAIIFSLSLCVTQNDHNVLLKKKGKKESGTSIKNRIVSHHCQWELFEINENYI